MTAIASLTGLTATAAQGAGPDADKARMEKTAQAFEAIFLRQMIGSMRSATLAEDVFGSSATDQFRELGDAKLADTLSETGSFGIAQLLLQQLERTAPDTRSATQAAGGAHQP